MKVKLSSEDKKKIKSKQEEIKDAKAKISDITDILESLTGDDRLAAEAKLDELRDIIRVSNRQLQEYNLDGEENGIILTKKIQSEKEVIVDLIKKHHIGYLCEENKYVYCLQMANVAHSGIMNPQFSVIDTSKVIPVLNKMSNRLLNIDPHSVRDLFQSTSNDYYRITGSFNSEKWDSTKVYNKMKIIKEYWVQPVDEPYNDVFDLLMRCVGGAKEENIDHLERWIAYKWRYPERNANIPNIDLGGYPGGNGKGRFIELLKTIFTHGCVVPAAKKELTDGFNASWETAVVLYYDEPATDELPEGKLKNATGSEEQRIEKKGIDAYTADRNYNMIFTSNNPKGVVTLAGTGASGEDRRWSVITTNIVMVDAVIEKYECTLDEAKIATNEINNIIKDRIEVGRWLNHILKKHDIENMTVLHPLHGQDYKRRFDDQKDIFQALFDIVLPIFKHCGVMTLDVLQQMVHNLADMPKVTPKTIKDKFNRYLEQNRVDFQYVKNKRINLLYQGQVSETLQKWHWVLPTSQTNFGLEYSMFSNVVPSKKTVLQKTDFTIEL